MVFSEDDEVLVNVSCKDNELWNKEIDQRVCEQKLVSVMVELSSCSQRSIKPAGTAYYKPGGSGKNGKITTWMLTMLIQSRSWNRSRKCTAKEENILSASSNCKTIGRKPSCKST